MWKKSFKVHIPPRVSRKLIFQTTLDPWMGYVRFWEVSSQTLQFTIPLLTA